MSRANDFLVRRGWAGLALSRFWTLNLLLTAGAALRLFGVYWDIAWHIDIGRDTFWSPPHLMLYLGVVLTLVVVALPTAVEAARGRRLHAPWGWWLMGLGTLAILLAAPLDELWHRRYGIDVTIWSLPHLVGIGGGLIVALGMTAFATAGLRESASRARKGLVVTLYGLFLAGATVPLGEYLFGRWVRGEFRTPAQFHGFDPALYPILLSLLAALPLVAATRALGAASAAALAGAGYHVVGLVIVGWLALLGHSQPRMPLLFPAALAASAATVLLARVPRGVGDALAGAAVGLAVAAFVPAPYGSVPLASVVAWSVVAGAVSGGLGGAFGALSARHGAAAL